MYIKHFFLVIVASVFLNPCFSQQNSNSNSQNGTYEFKGFVGILAGTSFIGSKNFAQWSNQVSNGNGMKSKGFINLGIQAFAVLKHFTYGMALSRESLLAAGASEMSPNRTNVAIHFGASLNNPSQDHHILTTIGFGYSILNVNLHGDPPLALRRNNLSNSSSGITQAAFLLNPKVIVVKLLKAGTKRIKVGFDAGLEICFPGNYKYGYSVGQGKTSHFIGYTLHGVPNFSPVSFCIGGFIGI